MPDERDILLAHGRDQGTNVLALALLAVASRLFTALFEFSWIWAYQSYKPSEIVDVYFTFAPGIPPMWKILARGLLIGVAAAALPAPRLKTAGVLGR
jgi:hypothetical protein